LVKQNVYNNAEELGEARLSIVHRGKMHGKHFENSGIIGSKA
jgi:hypothetical protein